MRQRWAPAKQIKCKQTTCFKRVRRYHLSHTWIGILTLNSLLKRSLTCDSSKIVHEPPHQFQLIYSPFSFVSYSYSTHAYRPQVSSEILISSLNFQSSKHVNKFSILSNLFYFHRILAISLSLPFSVAQQLKTRLCFGILYMIMWDKLINYFQGDSQSENTLHLHNKFRTIFTFYHLISLNLFLVILLIYLIFFLSSANNFCNFERFWIDWLDF